MYYTFTDKHLELIETWLEHEFYPATSQYSDVTIKSYLKSVYNGDVKMYSEAFKPDLNELRQKWIEYNKSSIK